MHYCPECGQACDCHGDIDDAVVETEEYVFEHCVCRHDLYGDEVDEEARAESIAFDAVAGDREPDASEGLAGIDWDDGEET